MARNSSFIKLDGTLDGLTFYNKDGSNFVKTKSTVSRNRIMNDPAYQRTRENMQEFGGAARCSKSFREGFAQIAPLVSDTYLSSRVTGKMRGLIPSGAGQRGERSLNVVDHVAAFIGFDFNINKLFDTHFSAPGADPVISAARDQVDWNLPDFNTDTYVRAPEGATHFKLGLAAGYVSNYEWDATMKEYVPVEDTPNGVGAVTYSAAIPLGGMVGATTDLTLDLSGFAPVPVTTALFASTAIVFYQMVNSELYVLAQGHAMKVAAAQ